MKALKVEEFLIHLLLLWDLNSILLFVNLSCRHLLLLGLLIATLTLMSLNLVTFMTLVTLTLISLVFICNLTVLQFRLFYLILLLLMLKLLLLLLLLKLLLFFLYLFLLMLILFYIFIIFIYFLNLNRVWIIFNWTYGLFVRISNKILIFFAGILGKLFNVFLNNWLILSVLINFCWLIFFWWV